MPEAGEKHHRWALLPLNDEQDAEYRILPHWLSLSLEMRICLFIEQYESWQNKIQQRATLGRDLTRTQQEKYDQWLLGTNPRLVFSREKQKLITEASQVQGDCIALQLHLSAEAENLKVTASGGAQFRLVLLKSDKPDDNDPVEAQLSKVCLST